MTQDYSDESMGMSVPRSECEECDEDFGSMDGDCAALLAYSSCCTPPTPIRPLPLAFACSCPDLPLFARQCQCLKTLCQHKDTMSSGALFQLSTSPFPALEGREDAPKLFYWFH